MPDIKFTIAIFTASSATFALVYLSNVWIFDVLLPVLKAWGLEFMIMPGLVIGVFGAGVVWYWIASWVWERLR